MRTPCIHCLFQQSKPYWIFWNLKVQYILGYYLHFHESSSVSLCIQHEFICFFPSISRVAIVSKSFEGKTDRTEEWYGTQYKQEAIPDEVIKVWLMQVWCVRDTEEMSYPDHPTHSPGCGEWWPSAVCTILRGVSTEMEGCILGFAWRNCTVAPSCSQRSLESKVHRKANLEDRQWDRNTGGSSLWASSCLHLRKCCTLCLIVHHCSSCQQRGINMGFETCMFR